MAASPVFKPSPSQGAILLLTLLALALGGSTQLWAQGFVLMGTGLFLVTWPPQRALGPAANSIFVLLIVVAACAFLPAEWFRMPPWRATMMAEFPGQMPATRSAQPWLTLENTLLFLAALAWAYSLQARTWSAQERRGMLHLFVFGMGLLAAVAAASLLTGRAIPIWTGAPAKAHAAWAYFSFFPNRNQTSDVLALAGIMANATALDAFRKKRFVALAFLILSLAIICTELFLIYSRAGILLFFGGTAAWQLCSLSFSRSAQWAALAAAFLVLALAAFFLGGGETLGRFQDKNLTELLHGVDFRVRVHQDAIRMTRAAPWVGVGLGNFKALFALSRTASVQDNAILHPESDWLWLAVEMGWGAVVLVVAGLALWLKKCFPFGEGSVRSLRAAAAVCVVAFALHGLEDVSAHRLGALWVALFLASLAVNGREGGPGRTPGLGVLFRLLGLVLAAASGLWLASSLGMMKLPTSDEVARLRQEAASFIELQDYKDAVAASSSALRIAPLDWTLYFQRAAAETRISQAVKEPRRDFATARYLEPHWEQLCLQEGFLWLAAGNEEYAINAWTEAMRRALDGAPARSENAVVGMFRQMLEAAQPDTALFAALRVLSRRDVDSLLLFLGHASSVEFDIESMRLLGQDPHLVALSGEQRATFFGEWFRQGDVYSLKDTLQDNPEFLKAAWKWLAMCYASFGQYREACQTVFRYAPAPPMPRFVPGRSLADVQRDYFVNPGDVERGIALCFEQEKEGLYDAALLTLKSVQPAAAPSYFPYIKARLWAEKGDYKEAWDSLQAFLPR